MAISRVKTWIAAETLTASDLNAEFDNVTSGGRATQAEMEAAAATDRFVTAGRQHFHPGHLNAWIEVSAADATPGISDSYNVSSVVADQTGEFTVNWDTNFAGTAYGVVATGAHDTPGNARIAMYDNSAQTAALVTVQFVNASGSLVDPNDFTVMGLRSTA